MRLAPLAHFTAATSAIALPDSQQTDSLIDVWYVLLLTNGSGFYLSLHLSIRPCLRLQVYFTDRTLELVEWR